jgi:predicted transglutaminase-like cysteine proteinase
LERVNDFFHLWRVTDDMLVWGERDHWATLLEFIVKFQGDSEDIALAKLVMLELMGVPRKNLYLGYVKQGKTSTPLMVLVWVSDDRSETLVLDHVDKSIRPGKERKDLQAIYLVNAEGHVILLKDEGGAREIVKESTDSAIHKLAAVFSRMGENRKNYQRFNDARPLFVSTDP